MKQKDIVAILVVTFVSVVISIFASKLLFATPANRQQQVQVVPAISSEFPTPSNQHFNNQAIDPTQLIHIGSNNNPTPFNNPQS